MLFAESVRDELRFSFAARGQLYDAERAGSLLERLGIAHLANRYPRDLSTGERQRAALAALLVSSPPVWLLDEPTRGLDNDAILALARLLRGRAADGGAVIVATHDARLARWCGRSVRLRDGTLTDGEQAR
jgi:energy-coupling factor transporter ATP-binding protein EcfA2